MWQCGAAGAGGSRGRTRLAPGAEPAARHDRSDHGICCAQQGAAPPGSRSPAPQRHIPHERLQAALDEHGQAHHNRSRGGCWPGAVLMQSMGGSRCAQRSTLHGHGRCCRWCCRACWAAPLRRAWAPLPAISLSPILAKLSFQFYGLGREIAHAHKTRSVGWTAAAVTMNSLMRPHAWQ